MSIRMSGFHITGPAGGKGAVVLWALLFCLLLQVVATAAPSIGGDPLYVQDNVFSSNGWGVTISSYVYDSMSSSLPGNFSLNPGEMLFVHLLDGDDSRHVAIDTFSIGNPNPIVVKAIGSDSSIVPEGFDAASFQEPAGAGYNESSRSCVFSFANASPESPLEPDEYSVVWYIAEATGMVMVNAMVSGAGEAANGAIPGPVVKEPLPPKVDFIAYNDLAGSSPAPATEIGLGSSGLLRDYDTGRETDVMLTVEGYLVYREPKEVPAFAGGDALEEFGKRIDTNDFIKESADSPDAWVHLIFTGLDPAKLYSVVVTGNRGANAGRTAKFTISDVNSFVNLSSPGAPWIDWDSVEFDTGVNTSTGYVAKFADIQPGNDGSMLVTVTPGPHNSDRNKFFLSQLKLTQYGSACANPRFDADEDGDVDHADFAVFQQCFSGPGWLFPDGCDCMNADSDADVDRIDEEAFEACASGAGVPADPACDDEPQ